MSKFHITPAGIAASKARVTFDHIEVDPANNRVSLFNKDVVVANLELPALQAFDSLHITGIKGHLDIKITS